jgi:hypothetical protein
MGYVVMCVDVCVLFCVLCCGVGWTEGAKKEAFQGLPTVIGKM